MENTDLQPKAKPNKKIFEYACMILAMRRYSISEFQSKLEKKFPDQSEENAEIIELFILRKYLDDTEYARMYLQEQLRRKPQGLRLIKQKLRQKGINETTISGVFQQELIDEEELVHKAALKKKQSLKNSLSALQRKQKLFRFLVSRGFHSEAILKTLKNLEK